MKWSDEHDLMLCREVLLLEPFKHPRQSKERGEIWGETALSLNSISSEKEEQASGITRDDETEIEVALSEIIEKEQAADLERKENSKTNENDKTSAENHEAPRTNQKEEC